MTGAFTFRGRWASMTITILLSKVSQSSGVEYQRLANTRSPLRQLSIIMRKKKPCRPARFVNEWAGRGNYLLIKLVGLLLGRGSARECQSSGLVARG